MDTTSVITFKPLKRNRYRCNQTGQVVKKGGMDSLRRIILGRNKPKTPKIPQVAFNFWGVECPKCGEIFQPGYDTIVRCPTGHKIRIV